jgi:hypothetical protein
MEELKKIFKEQHLDVIFQNVPYYKSSQIINNTL